MQSLVYHANKALNLKRVINKEYSEVGIVVQHMFSMVSDRAPQTPLVANF